MRWPVTRQLPKLLVQCLIKIDLSIRRKRHRATVTRDRRLRVSISKSRSLGCRFCFSQLTQLFAVKQKDLGISVGIPSNEIFRRCKYDYFSVARDGRTHGARASDFSEYGRRRRDVRLQRVERSTSTSVGQVSRRFENNRPPVITEHRI